VRHYECSSNTPIYHDTLIAWHNQRLWWLLCGAGAIIVVLSVTLCLVMLRPHSTPWVIEVSSKGEPVGAVTPLAGSQTIADSTIRWAIGEYIQNAFRISPNFEQEKTMLSRAYALSAKQTADTLTAYYHADGNAHNPLMVIGKYWQDVQILDTLKLAPKDTYQVDYVMRRHDHPHELNPVATTWRATMRVLQGKPIDGNPLGLFVTDLDFEPEAK
jgi:type IV secretory pathway TrbF-like protein